MTKQIPEPKMKSCQMKSFVNAVLVFIAILAFPGCQSPTSPGASSKSFALQLQDFPDYMSSYNVCLQSYSVDVNEQPTLYDNTSLGPCSPTGQIDKQQNISSKARYASVYLFEGNNSEPSYFMSWDLS